MRIDARTNTARIEAELSRASRKVELLADVRHARADMAIEYHAAYATWHKCSAILAKRRGDNPDGLGGMAWHQRKAAHHLKLAGGAS
ncbi:hypothetical protein ACFO0O_00575 [Cobetia amphilecti]|uniref:Uncharacterized protein n=1 Tax=Cobetia amphilecti TaxID=1055104 RepID=A0ABT6UTM9_9GAMM|nr:hypothetical protein [Cobetia amphilecti]MDI5886070.1 hypothetical protein [Cobetia amphilecti]